MVFEAETQDMEFLSLQALNSLEQRGLLNVVDKLRAQGLSAFTALPQLIVCGDQSSGKSSVLAALSELPFPRKDNLCTRFATEVILRRSDKLSIAVSIGSGIGRPAEEQHKDFAKRVKSKDEFPAIFESARAAMGLTHSGQAFSDHILRIEIRGPTYPQLTIVDLPGLIHTETKMQTVEDVELVSKLVRDYMINPKSIILAVVSAKNDIANQIVLQKAREIDREGLRTLGIITKPDQLYPSSHNEESFLELARNEQVKFKLGWHVVKNQDLASGSYIAENRDTEEAEYFRESNFRRLPSSQLGIINLRTRLSNVLFEQVRTELPALVRDIEGKLSICQDELAKLGTPLRTTEDQRLFLLQLSQGFQSLCHSAMEGSYHHDFFGNGLSKAALEKRLRARVRNLAMEFSHTIRTEGTKWTIASSQDEKDRISRGEKGLWTRKQAVNHVLGLLKANRGQELPGLPSPRLVGTVFREYSSPWEAIARRHVEEVGFAARRFLELALGHLTNPRIAHSLLGHWVNPKMDAALVEAGKQLDSLLQVHKREPMTTNHYFTETAHKLKQKRIQSSVEAKLRSLLIPDQRLTEANIQEVLHTINDTAEPDMDRHAAEAALDNMQAFYKTAMKLFIDNVPNLVTEVAIIAPLPELFRPQDVLQMSEKDLVAITAESKETKARREELTSELAVLLDGAKTCKEYATYQNRINDARYERAHVETTEEVALLSQVSDDGSTRSSYVIDNATPPSPPVLTKRPRRIRLASVSPPPTPTPPNAPLLVEEDPVLIEEALQPVEEVFVEEALQPIEEDSWGTWGLRKKISKKDKKKEKKASASYWDEEPTKASDEDKWLAAELSPPQLETVAPVVERSWGFAKATPAPALEPERDFDVEPSVVATEDPWASAFNSVKKSKKKAKKPTLQPEVYASEV